MLICGWLRCIRNASHIWCADLLELVVKLKYDRGFSLWRMISWCVIAAMVLKKNYIIALSVVINEKLMCTSWAMVLINQPYLVSSLFNICNSNMSAPKQRYAQLSDAIRRSACLLRSHALNTHAQSLRRCCKQRCSKRTVVCACAVLCRLLRALKQLQTPRMFPISRLTFCGTFTFVPAGCGWLIKAWDDATMGRGRGNKKKIRC